MVVIDEEPDLLTLGIDTPIEEECEYVIETETEVLVEEEQKYLEEDATIEDGGECLIETQTEVDTEVEPVTGIVIIGTSKGFSDEKKVPRSRKATVKKNPLKNDVVMFSLNPYAKIQKRQARLQAEAPKAVKKRKSKREKKAFRPQPRPEPSQKQKVAKQKKPKKKPSPKPEPEPEVEEPEVEDITPEEPDQQIFYPTEPSQPESCFVEEILEVVETEEYIIEDAGSDIDDEDVVIDIRPEAEDLLEADTEVLVEQEPDILEPEVYAIVEEADEDLIEADTEVLVEQEPDILEPDVYAIVEEADEDLIEADTEVLVEQEPDILEPEVYPIVEAAAEYTIEADLNVILEEPADNTLVEEDLEDLLGIDEDEIEAHPVVEAVVEKKPADKVEPDGSPISPSPEPQGEEDDEVDFMDFLSHEFEVDAAVESEPEAEVTTDAKHIDAAEAVAEAKPVCPEPVVAAKSDQDDAPPSPEPEADDDGEVDFMDFL